MAIERYVGKIKSPRKRGFSKPSYRDLHTGKVTVDDEGRVFLFGTEEVNAVVIECRFHFFEAETGEDWPKVRARHGLPKTRRHSCYSHGVRQGEGFKVGLYPKRPINVIQEERGKEAGEKSGRMPAYGKQFERMILRDIAQAEAEAALKPKSTTDTVVNKDPFDFKDPFAPDEDELPF